MYKRWKENNGVTLVSLGVLIAVLVIISATMVLNIKDKYDAQKLDKLASDLQLLTEKISIYYAKNKDYPTIGEKETITVGESTVDIYKIDLEKLQGLTLNFGKDYKTSEDDYYGIDATKGTVYYKKGINGIYNLVQAESTDGIEIVKITEQPKWQSTYQGENVTFSIAVDDESVTYQWYVSDTYEGEGAPIAGATNSTLTISNVDKEDEKYYYCKIIYPNISTKSNVAKLSLRNYINYKIYGNTVDGVSVGDYEDVVDKYNIPVTVSGKNLYDAEGHFNAICESETLVGYEPIKGVVDGVECYQYYARNFSKQSSPEIARVPSTFKENTQYTISFDAYDIFYTNPSTGITYNGINIAFVYTDGTIKSLSNFNGITKEEKIWKHWSVSSEANKTLDYIKWSYSTGSAQTFFANFQIEEGTSETEYEPYKEITTNIYLDEPLRKVGEKKDFIDFENQKVVRYISEMDGVLNVLETPEEENIELPQLSTVSSKTYIKVDTAVEPSNIETY